MHLYTILLDIKKKDIYIKNKIKYKRYWYFTWYKVKKNCFYVRVCAFNIENLAI